MLKNLPKANVHIRNFPKPRTSSELRTISSQNYEELFKSVIEDSYDNYSWRTVYFFFHRQQQLQ